VSWPLAQARLRAFEISSHGQRLALFNRLPGRQPAC